MLIKYPHILTAILETLQTSPEFTPVDPGGFRLSRKDAAAATQWYEGGMQATGTLGELAIATRAWCLAPRFRGQVGRREAVSLGRARGLAPLFSCGT